MVLLMMYSPSVYNQSCSWPGHTLSKPAISNANASAAASVPTAGHDWMGSVLATAAAGPSLSGYDVFRCAVVLAVTCGLISGNLILALAVNCKYSAGILQFQVRLFCPLLPLLYIHTTTTTTTSSFFLPFARLVSSLIPHPSLPSDGHLSSTGHIGYCCRHPTQTSSSPFCVCDLAEEH